MDSILISCYILMYENDEVNFKNNGDDMTKAVLEKLIVKETKDLPTETLNQILDFIQFIKAKGREKFTGELFEKDVNDELSELNKMSLLHLEEEFAGYKEQYPHEQ